MASEKARRILVKYEAPFSPEQMATMREPDAWAWITSHEDRMRELKAQTRLPEICFTGFTNAKRIELAEIAARFGFKVKESVTKNLVILVVGQDPGPSKVAKAEAQKCTITDEPGFMSYLQSVKEI